MKIRCPKCNDFPRMMVLSRYGRIFWHNCARLKVVVFWNEKGQYDTTYKHLRNRMKTPLELT